MKLAAFASTFIGALLTHTGVMVISYTLHLILARNAGVSEYGVYAYLYSWVSVCALLGVFGFDLAQKKYVPTYFESCDWPRLRGLLFVSIVIPIVISIVLSAGLSYVFRDVLAVTESLRSVSLYAVALVPLVVWVRILQSQLVAFKRPVLAQVPEGIVQQGLMVILMACGSFYALFHVTAKNIFISLIGLTAVVGLLATIYVFKKVYPAELNGRHSSLSHYKMWLSVAIPSAGMSVTALLLKQTDTLMLGAMQGTRESGIYVVASKVAALVSVPLTVANIIIVPYISSYYYSEDRYRLQKYLTRSMRISGAVAVCAGLFVWVLGGSVLRLFGDEFAAGLPALKILVLGNIADVLVGSVGFILMVTGHQWYAFKVLFLMVLLNVLLNYLLIEKLGMHGAALSTAFVTVMWNLILLFAVYTKVNVNPAIFRLTRM